MVARTFGKMFDEANRVSLKIHIIKNGPYYIYILINLIYL
jgi:hypothetical protein